LTFEDTGLVHVVSVGWFDVPDLVDGEMLEPGPDNVSRRSIDTLGINQPCALDLY
jgi:hypothetical protein